MNSVNLIGNLAADPETREAGEHTVTSFRLAVNRRRVRGEDRGAIFITVEAWNGTGKIVADFAGKGDRIGVTGRIELDEWTTDGDQHRSRTFIVAESVDLLTPPPSDN